MNKFNPDSIKLDPTKQNFEQSFLDFKNADSLNLSDVSNLTNEYLDKRIDLFKKFIQYTMRYCTENISSKSTSIQEVVNALKETFDRSVIRYNEFNLISLDDKMSVDRVTFSCWEDQLKAELESLTQNYFSVVDDYIKAGEVLDKVKEISKDKELFSKNVVRFLERKTKSGGFYLNDELHKTLTVNEAKDLIAFMNKNDLWGCFDNKLNSDDSIRAYNIFKILMNISRQDPSILQ